MAGFGTTRTACVCVNYAAPNEWGAVKSETKTAGRRRVSRQTHTDSPHNTTHTLHCTGTRIVPNLSGKIGLWYQSGTTVGRGV